VGRGQQVIYREVWYKGQVRVHLIGLWKPEWAEPLWVMSNLEPEEALRIYLQRMKIAEAFRDLKGLLGLGRQMNKSREYMEKVVALLLLVYTIGLLVGERWRDFPYGTPLGEGEGAPAGVNPHRPWWKGRCYSGLFVLLKQRWVVSLREWQAIVGGALAAFLALLFPPVPTHVGTSAGGDCNIGGWSRLR
jgi:hypothetical protein